MRIRQPSPEALLCPGSTGHLPRIPRGAPSSPASQLHVFEECCSDIRRASRHPSGLWRAQRTGGALASPPAGAQASFQPGAVTRTAEGTSLKEHMLHGKTIRVINKYLGETLSGCATSPLLPLTLHPVLPERRRTCPFCSFADSFPNVPSNRMLPAVLETPCLLDPMNGLFSPGFLRK